MLKRTMAQKRAAEDILDTPPPTQRTRRDVGGSSGGTGNSGQHGIPEGESESPMERPIPFNHVTFTFRQRSWEEIDCSLKTLPLTIALHSMLDDEMIDVISNVLPTCLGFRIHKPMVKISNFIVLTDEITVRSNSPTEMSSFVQQSKIIHFMPKHTVTTGYTITNTDSASKVKMDDLLKQKKDNFLVSLPNTENFEKLNIHCISHPIHANLLNNDERYQGYILNDVDYGAHDLLAAATTEEEKEWLNCRYYYGIVDETGTVSAMTDNWETKQMTVNSCRNRDKIEILGAGDIIEFEVETNCEGDMLYPDLINTRTPGIFNTFQLKGIEKKSQLTTIKRGYTPWPSSFNPKLYRRNAALGSQWLFAKYKPLQHHFFTMVPIKKNNGSLMKTRASCMMEQSFQVTFVFRDDETSTVAPLDMCHLRARGGWVNGRQNYNEMGTLMPFLT
ncbi:uncharacterized protein LOC124159636 [Ischnura elegans]|uniref:uncharacterized protein LOC124159636 n=1 Tax=Ischnura elegans TaxID=197161 RepID=UPI001ED88393|nr:uncharacterized protein LOC124159636 [Ischnura elegans]